jgi:hypothetical protein
VAINEPSCKFIDELLDDQRRANKSLPFLEAEKLVKADQECHLNVAHFDYLKIQLAEQKIRRTIEEQLKK